ncbi:MAG: helix-turn-helix transcriptional regulator [Flammeovirgaceae bacterium]
MELFPIGKSTWWEGVRLQKYPQPVKLSSRITAWRRSDIQTLLENPKNSYFPR